MKKIAILSFCLIWLVSSPFVVGDAARGEVVQFSTCDENPGSCTIQEVRINPCAEAREDKPCKVKRGKNATIEFDYSAQWETDRAHGQVYAITDEGHLPMDGMNTNACQHTPCPIQNATNQTYIYTLPLHKKYQPNTYTIKWVLRNGHKAENTTERCCFITKIKLVK